MARVLVREDRFEHVGKEHVFTYGYALGINLSHGPVAHERFVVVELDVVQGYAAARRADKGDAELQITRAAGQGQRCAGLLALCWWHLFRYKPVLKPKRGRPEAPSRFAIWAQLCA